MIRKPAGGSIRALSDAVPDLWQVKLQRRDGGSQTICLDLFCAKAELQENILELWNNKKAGVARRSVSIKRGEEE